MSHGHSSQKQAYSIPKPLDGISHIIAVSSGKGGVGKSTVAVNLATALAMQGAKVGLMDADIYGPNVPTMMGITEQPKIEVHPEKGELFIPPVAHGVKVMSMGFLLDGDQPLAWRGPMLHSVVNQFFNQVKWGELDYLIVDMPPGTGDVQLSLAQLVPVRGVILVSTPQEVSMQDVRKAFHMFKAVHVPIMGVVENMSVFTCNGCQKKHSLFGSDGGVRLKEQLNIPLLAELPFFPQVRKGGDEGHPVVTQEPDSEIGKAFRDLADKVIKQVNILKNEKYHPSQIVQIERWN